MAIYHFHAKIIGRSSGRSTTAAAAYRSGERITDHRTALIHDYTAKAVDHSEILLPDGAPEWMSDRSKLWNEVEKVERRKDAQLSREFEFSLPNELTNSQNIALAKGFLMAEMVQKGMVVDACFHALGTQGHCHAMTTMRDVSSDGFGKKNRSWNKKDFLEKLRAAWANHCNAALSAAGHDARVDHRTLVDQGITDRPAQIKEFSRPSEAVKLHNQKCRGIRELQIEIDAANEEISVRQVFQAKRLQKTATPLPKTATPLLKTATDQIKHAQQIINTTVKKPSGNLSAEQKKFVTILNAERMLRRAKLAISMIRQAQSQASKTIERLRMNANGWIQKRLSNQKRKIAQTKTPGTPGTTVKADTGTGFDRQQHGPEP